MEKLPLNQGQGFRGAYALYEDVIIEGVKTRVPIDITTRNVEIKLVNVQADKVHLTILNANIVKTNNIAAFTVAGSSTTTFIGTYKVQVAVDGLDVTDKIISLTPSIIEFSKTY